MPMTEKSLSLDQLRALQAQRKTLDEQLKSEERRLSKRASTVGFCFLEHFERNKDSFSKTCLDFLHRTLTDEKQRREAGLQELMDAQDAAEKRPNLGPASSALERKAG